MTQAVKHSWLKDRRFWIFWIIQIIAITLIVLFPVKDILVETFVAAQWTNGDQYVPYAIAMIFVQIFILQFVTAAVYQRAHFVTLMALTLLAPLQGIGLSIALAMRAVDGKMIERYRTLLVIALSIIGWLVLREILALVSINLVEVLFYALPPELLA